MATYFDFLKRCKNRNKDVNFNIIPNIHKFILTDEIIEMCDEINDLQILSITTMGGF